MSGRDAFAKTIDVSRETMDRLDKYEALLRKWNPSINLVAKSTLDDVWNRHFLDSAQIFSLANTKSGHWVDVGTGGGFPGAVVATMAVDAEMQFTFVESDSRKATFLSALTRELGLKVTVIAKRIEDIDPIGADILSARALAPLVGLLPMAKKHLNPTGQALFMKGASFRKELAESLESWTFHSDECPSITDDNAVVLKLGDIKRV